jgi:hypothetical protein
MVCYFYLVLHFIFKFLFFVYFLFPPFFPSSNDFTGFVNSPISTHFCLVSSKPPPLPSCSFLTFTSFPPLLPSASFLLPHSLSLLFSLSPFPSSPLFLSLLCYTEFKEFVGWFDIFLMKLLEGSPQVFHPIKVNNNSSILKKLI